MKRLPAAKKNQLIGVIVATVALICVVYFVLINPQNEKNRGLAVSIGQKTSQLQQYKKSIQQMEATKTALDDLSQQLGRAEEDVASGDQYAWTYDTIRRFKTGYKLEIANPGQPSLGECDLVGEFPYKQIRFTLTGTGYYHEIGKFVSDFENKFAHCRVLNLSAEPASGEKLAFRMEIVALVKPNN